MARVDKTQLVTEGSQMTTSKCNAASPFAMSPTNNPVTLFEKIARTTWEWLGEARERKLGFSEETVTDITALQIAEVPSSQVKIAKATRQEERRCGIDWMWFIGNPRQGYSRYAVQAKKVTLSTSTNFSYRLRYRVSRIPGLEFQIEVLERFARRARATPLYCFYNNVGPFLATRHWHCRAYPNPPDDIRQMGCTIVPLDAVLEVHKPQRRKDFSAVHRDERSLPWRCLFHRACLAAAFHGKSDDRKGISASRPSQVRNTDPYNFGSLPEFLLNDNPVVEIDDVIHQLELAGQWHDLDSEAMPAPAVPAWFVVIESESRWLEPGWVGVT